MIVRNKPLSRRTVLRGMGAAVALPFLDAMSPAFAAPNRLTASAPVRMAFAYVPNGIIMEDWTPEREGKDFDLPRLLEPIADLRDDGCQSAQRRAGGQAFVNSRLGRWCDGAGEVSAQGLLEYHSTCGGRHAVESDLKLAILEIRL